LDNRLGPIRLSLEEVIVLADDKVFMEVKDNNALIVGYLNWILSQQLRPCPVHLLNILKSKKVEV
jgi:hypothetical protein